MKTYSLSKLKTKIQAVPKQDLIHLPTPFKKLENLSRALKGPEIFIKRDDLTGLAFGGNKSRKLEFIIQDVLDKKADVVITWASLQSNWCLQTAAVAKRFGLTPVLVLFKTYDLPEEWDGNLLLDYILGADIRIREAEKGKVVREEDAEGVLQEIAYEVRGRGHSPYIAPVGGSLVGGSMDKPLGAISYLNAFIEAVEQAEKQGIGLDYMLHATGSGGTQAGLTVGAKAWGRKTRVLGVSVSDDKEAFGRDVYAISQDTIQALDLDIEIDRGDIIVLDEYIQEGYGVVNREVAEAIRLVSTQEGIFLDPVYTGKAMAALMDLVKKGFFRKEDKILFFHTGGTPALFPNKHLLTKLLKP